MLVINRIKFTMIHQVHHIRRFDHRHTIILENGVDAGDKTIQVRHMGQHIVGQEDICPFTRFSQLGCQFTAEESNQGRHTGSAGCFSRGLGWVNPQHRDALLHEILEHIAIIAGCLNHQTLAIERATIFTAHLQRISCARPKVAQEGSGHRREIGILSVKENLWIDCF